MMMLIYILVPAVNCINIKEKNYSDKKCISMFSERPVIMLTGYWNPTGNMIASFSNKSSLNPYGWKGANWENLGYDIYSFFPDPQGYFGDFEVDYQDTLSDFLSITTKLKPIAIISFGNFSSGRGLGDWEVEFNARNLNSWIKDNKRPKKPEPCPPEASSPVGYIRHSSLPVQKIEDAVTKLISIKAKVDWIGNPGAYLCEYIAYLGMSYQSSHKNDILYPCKAAGFIHVNGSLPLEKAMLATNVTIRETIKYLNNEEQNPETPSIKGPLKERIMMQNQYSFNAVDPNFYNVRYFIDWGDSNLEWSDYCSSNEDLVVNHTWVKKGTYTVMAIAMNTHSSMSQWGTLTITMSKSYSYNKILKILIKISECSIFFEKILKYNYNLKI